MNAHINSINESTTDTSDYLRGVSAASRYLAVSRNTTYELMAAGMPSYLVTGKLRLFRKSELDHWISQAAVNGVGR